MTAEEIHNFNINNEDIEIIKNFSYLCLIINSSGDYSQEIKTRLKLRRAAMEELRKIT